VEAKRKRRRRKRQKIIRSIEMDMHGARRMAVWKKSAMKDIEQKGRWITN